MRHEKFNGAAMSRRGVATLVALVALGIAGTADADAAGVTEALDRPAVTVRDPAHAVLLGATAVGPRWFGVGERGLILASDDGGQRWTQQASPVSVTLTAVAFADVRFGVAVGHGGVVLMTEDGGLTWSRRLDGRMLAKFLLAEAKAHGDQAAAEQAQQLVTDGPDKPWLDLSVPAPGHALVVGAYGLALRTADGGRTWQSLTRRIDNPRGLHLYAVRQIKDRILVAGEQGLVALSEDGGRSFSRLATPYKGSFFAAQLVGERDLFVAGLRGTALRSSNAGQDWTAISNPVPASITSAVTAPSGTVLVSNQAGQILALRDQTLVTVSSQALPPLNGLLATDPQRVLALTLQGPMVVPIEGGRP